MAIHEEVAYEGSTSDLTHTEAAARDVVMLPLFPGMTDEQQAHVISCLAEHAVSQAA
jgi:dTDP-4-amino-4,6-dideoxygalactose transaminase